MVIALTTLALSAAEPNPLMMLPFALLLLCIAVAPLAAHAQWERAYKSICAAFALFTCVYYAIALRGGSRVLHAGLDYASFMIVVGSFYVVAGGIHIHTRGSGRPLSNTIFLLCGGVLANLVGTVGASMLLIRPWMTMNRNRFAKMHMAFFIFVVSNVGGALLPVGPPLFLGYLKGVPFWWPLQRCWMAWGITLGALLLVFYFVDVFAWRTAAKRAGFTGPANPGNWHCDGAKSFAFLVILLGALIGVPPVWRELVMAGAAAIAFFLTPARLHAANAFSFRPIVEVAWIFLGIFGTMIPVLDYMKLHAADLGLRTDMQFFWATGVLSALLDNAPTYLTFLAGALGLHQLDVNTAADVAAFVREHDQHLVAISLGATFFGALTYIGNGPNLLVKAIADQAKMPTPSFFGFIFKWALPVLLPILTLVSLLFFR
jgi:Na+/H+ antiporter NhaD/arsenite permease-like protein